MEAVPHGPTGLILEGEPGIGKTVLWRACLESARQRDHRVLSARPAESETKLAFGGLDDLLVDVLEQCLPALSAPKRRALEVALLRAEPKGSPPDRRTMSRAVLDLLRLLSAQGPVIIAVDDAQWLDLPSARVVAFVARRLEDQPVGILLAVRLEGRRERVPLDLDRAFPEERLRSVRLSPLDLAGIHQVLLSRLGESLPRYVLVRIYEQSGGNPFFALEIARTLLGSGTHPSPGEDLSVPDDLGELLRHRLATLSPKVRNVLLFAAALSQPTVSQVSDAADGDPLELLQEAVQGGIVELHGERIRFTHPLLASVLYADAPTGGKRDMHRRMAEVAGQVEERARHLAMSAIGADAAIASTLEEAARNVATRGAPSIAAILSEEAHRLTPPEDEEDRQRREVAAADYHFRAGDTARAHELLDDAQARSSPGPDRAWVRYRLGSVRSQEESWPEAEGLLREALAESGEDLHLRAEVHQQLALARLVAGDLPGAAAHAHQAVPLAESVAHPRLLAYSLGAVATYDFLLGQGVRTDVLERADALEKTAGPEPMPPFALVQPRVAWGIILKWTDDFDGARVKLEGCYRRALEIGDESSVPFILYHLSELECWAGDWDGAARHAEEGHKVALQSEAEAVRPAALYARALVAAHRGRMDLARADAEEALILCQRSGNVPVMQLTLSVLGFIALSLGDFAAAHERLGPMSASIAAVGLGEPGVVKFLPDEIESLVGLGELDDATTLLDAFEERARDLDRIWALATGARCRALLDAAAGDPEAAERALERALEKHRRLPMPFEQGRTLLAAGTIHRRGKHKRAAKDCLQQALVLFESLGAPLWAEKASQELARVGLRPAAPPGLTPSEQRVANLVAAGMTNKEVAAALFISPKTVDSNLSRIYRKLGVRSRTELAAKLLGTDDPASPEDRVRQTGESS